MVMVAATAVFPEGRISPWGIGNGHNSGTERQIVVIESERVSRTVEPLLMWRSPSTGRAQLLEGLQGLIGITE
ncbi:hypothetical protein DSCOOX_62310 [Desulfosarcina ovata subsp. ovata]|uniref:Uncharacterized protein n=1 Tax=Desulfosarcina ovata subsp. ovata TaxID=2752305 RepID=A0A5K8AK40_9BACT|nr:hypothetical protein DSCOOX_62310 [Desulfosarcina ovata subsp. ovata]